MVISDHIASSQRMLAEANKATYALLVDCMRIKEAIVHDVNKEIELHDLLKARKIRYTRNTSVYIKILKLISTERYAVVYKYNRVLKFAEAMGVDAGRLEKWITDLEGIDAVLRYKPKPPSTASCIKRQIDSEHLRTLIQYAISGIEFTVTTTRKTHLYDTWNQWETEL